MYNKKIVESENKKMHPYRAYVKTIRNFATFRGRTSRAEYWAFISMDLVIALGLLAIGVFVDYQRGSILQEKFLSAPVFIGPFMGAFFFGYFLFRLIPYLAATVRRLHDTNRTGWWVLPLILPMFVHTALERFLVIPTPPITETIIEAALGILSLVVFIFLVKEGSQGDNAYDPQ